MENLADLLTPTARPGVSFELPWPWGGEQFELRGMRAITYITGPLGSGKTKLAERIAQTLPDATYLGLDRLKDGYAASQAILKTDPSLRHSVEEALSWLLEDGAEASSALSAIIAAVCSVGEVALVVDMPKQGLNGATQQALVALLRRRGPGGRPVFLLTRSSAILDFASVGEEETVVLCPANHAVPMIVRPHPGAAGYEAVATCLALPEVRMRTEGVVAMRPEAS